MFFWKSSTIDFWLGSKYGSCQYRKKKLFKRYLPSYVKLSVSLFLSCMFYFVAQIRKTEREKKLNLWSLFINRRSRFSSSLTESLKMTCARSYAWFLNILSKGEGLESFLRPNVLPKLSKITVTSSKSVKMNE